MSQDQLLEIADDLSHKVFEGLNAAHQEILCLPTYVPWIDVPKNGQALVLDFGGTNVRAAVASWKNGKLTIEKGPAAKTIPVKRGIPLERNEFLESLSALIVSLDPPDNLPVGYCFSYPAESTPDGDARLVTWTKEVFVKETIGEKMGHMLLKHLSEYNPPVQCSKVTVINDTVASLLAGSTTSDADGYIGLVVGTGTNMATLMEPAMIPKLPKDLHWKEPIPINLESGNFTPPHLTRWDALLDAASENPGRQRFEKAVSGAYLAQLLKVAYPATHIDPIVGSKAVVQTAYESTDADEREIELARQILLRSSQLVAAALAGLITVFKTSQAWSKVCIAAEGGLFLGAPNYEKTTRTTLRALLDALKLSDLAVEFVTVQNTNLLGSILATLTRSPSLSLHSRPY